ncbi:MAG: taurine dioxygenase [Gammaproteobacteria bacterium]|jgi:taurine dioxygenase
MEVRPLTGSEFVAEVVGLDASKALDAEQVIACRQVLADHRVLVFRDQMLEPEAYVAFAKNFGTPVPHVLDHLRMDGTPEIMLVGNIGQTARGERVHHGADYWHTDMSYEASPAIATMLYSLVAPTTGGETQFADLATAFDALPEDEQERLSKLMVNHRYGAASKGQAASISNQQYARTCAVQHPLMKVNPINGQRSLYAITGTPECIDGMREDETDQLLSQLREHSISERFIYRHPYRVGDVAIWDTTATLHSATTIPTADGPDNSRLLWRISVVGG